MIQEKKRKEENLARQDSNSLSISSIEAFLSIRRNFEAEQEDAEARHLGHLCVGLRTYGEARFFLHLAYCALGNSVIISDRSH